MTDELTYKFEGVVMPVSNVIEKVTERAQQITDPASRQAYIDYWGKIIDHVIVINEVVQKNRLMNNRIIGVIGLIGLIGMMAFVYFNPYATKWQSGFWWIGACVFTGACAAALPGLFEFKVPGVLRATASIGIMAFMYYHPPVIMDKDFDKPKERLKYFAVLTDTSKMATIPVDYSSHSSENICAFSKKAMIKHYGNYLDGDTLVFYRKSDGQIYSTETCSDITEGELIVVSNKVIRFFGDPKTTYEYIYAKVK